MKKTILFTLLPVLLWTLGYGQDSLLKKMENVKPFVLGTIEQLMSEKLSEKRILNIYLPEGYHKNDTARYPVIYLLDGSADEDFINVVGLVQFNSFS